MFVPSKTGRLKARLAAGTMVLVLHGACGFSSREPLTGSTGPTTAGVNTSGSFRTNVPILRPEFHGIEPSLSLVYDSARRGHGVTGVGWALLGASTIQRTSAIQGAPRYQADDVFVLDGTPLQPCHSTTQSPSCRYASPNTNGYFATIEDYRRISFLRTRGSKGRWIVSAGDGTRFIYEARYHATAKDAFAWDLSEVHDTDGNVVKYDWVADRSAAGGGESYLDAISYGPVRVQLRYSDRPDSFSYADGEEIVAVRWRLSSIEILVLSCRAVRRGGDSADLFGFGPRNERGVATGAGRPRGRGCLARPRGCLVARS